MPGTTSTDLPSFSHDQHHETDAAKWKGGPHKEQNMTKQQDVCYIKQQQSNTIGRKRGCNKTSQIIITFTTLHRGNVSHTVQNHTRTHTYTAASIVRSFNGTS